MLQNDTSVDKYGNMELTTTTIHRVWYHLCLVLLVRLGGYIANLSDFYSYRFIGKLTVFLELQELSFHRWHMMGSYLRVLRLVLLFIVECDTVYPI